MAGYTLEQIRASYEQKRDWERQLPVSYYLFRPLSFPVTVVVSRLTKEPARVAAAGAVISLAGSAFLVAPGAGGIWWGIALLALAALSDAVDGNLARTGGLVSYRGRFLDGAIGFLTETLYLPCLAAGLYLDASGRFVLLEAARPEWRIVLPAAGAVACICLLAAGGLQHLHESLRQEKERAAGTRPPPVTAPYGSSTRRGDPLYALFSNLGAFNVQVSLLALSAAFGAADLFLLLLCAYALTRLAVFASYYFTRGLDQL